ncbi:unnamed protein product [Adineta ricciae]|uniref:Uncharacterized protein n=1 Tax=Adineta ricciae TaxID=249248 RepID=A0A813TNA5_ADIRI|nr:unnamed protein product [Adineta ricciae]CAF1319827.1 unnamed protein product [Adineta ricciae]
MTKHVFVMVIYSSVLIETITEQVVHPTLDEEYPLTLMCPCSQMPIPYEDFVQVWWYQTLSFPNNPTADSGQYANRLPLSTYIALVKSYVDSDLQAVNVCAMPSYVKKYIDGTKCFCALDSSCNLEDWVLTAASLKSVSWGLPGIIGGYTMVDTVFRSSFVSWLNDDLNSTLTRVLKDAGAAVPRFPRILSSTVPNRYATTASAESILNHLMIEDWNVTYSYENYYFKCF